VLCKLRACCFREKRIKNGSLNNEVPIELSDIPKASEEDEIKK